MTVKRFDLYSINRYKSTSFAKAAEILNGAEALQHYGANISGTDMENIVTEMNTQREALQRKLATVINNLNVVAEKVGQSKDALEVAEMMRRLILKDIEEKWYYTDDGNPLIKQLKTAKCDLSAMKKLENKTDLLMLRSNYQAEIDGIHRKLNNRHTLLINAVKKIKGKVIAEKINGYSDTIPQYSEFYQNLIENDCTIIISRDERQFCLASEHGVWEREHRDRDKLFYSCHKWADSNDYHGSTHELATIDNYFIMRIIDSQNSLLARAYFYQDQYGRLFHTGMYTKGLINNSYRDNNGYQTIFDLILSKAVFGNSSYHTMKAHCYDAKLYSISSGSNCNSYFNENDNYLQHRIEKTEHRKKGYLVLEHNNLGLYTKDEINYFCGDLWEQDASYNFPHEHECGYCDIYLSNDRIKRNGCFRVNVDDVVCKECYETHYAPALIELIEELPYEELELQVA